MKRSIACLGMVMCLGCGLNIGGNSAQNTGDTGGATSSAPSSTGGSSGSSSGSSTGGDSAPTSGPTTRFIGRTRQNGSSTQMAWSGVAVATRFTGASLTMAMQSDGASQANVMELVIDGTPTQTIPLVTGQTSYTATVSSGTHSALLFKRTEAGDGVVDFGGFTTDGQLLPAATAPGRLIEFIGDSITAGYGIEATSATCPMPAGDWAANPDYENAWDAYGPTTARTLNADWSVIAWSGHGLMRNLDATTTNTLPQLYGFTVPTDTTSTYDFAAQPDVVVINLGTNDFNPEAGGIPPQAQWTAAYEQFLTTIRGHYPKAYILVCLGPMLSDYYPAGTQTLTTARTYLQAIVASAQKSVGQVGFFEFPVNTGDYGCDDHPNAAYQAQMASLLAAQIQKVTNWK